MVRLHRQHSQRLVQRNWDHHHSNCMAPLETSECLHLRRRTTFQHGAHSRHQTRGLALGTSGSHRLGQHSPCNLTYVPRLSILPLAHCLPCLCQLEYTVKDGKPLYSLLSINGMICNNAYSRKKIAALFVFLVGADQDFCTHS